MWFFKRKKGTAFKAVIHNDCYQKLPNNLKNRFYPAPSDSEVTHKVASSPDGDGEGSGEEFILGAIVEGALDLMLGSEDTPTENYSIEDPAPDMAADPEPQEQDFGGGGASDSY
jgi:hypothetical protein